MSANFIVCCHETETFTMVRSASRTYGRILFICWPGPEGSVASDRASVALVSAFPLPTLVIVHRNHPTYSQNFLALVHYTNSS